ncbi:MAG: hypothetical protein P1U46_03540 [Patescibacteria group bacterium]|nr:hypothetical protein [Patescibacteria group bacterium]
MSEIHLSKDEIKDYDNAFNERYDEVSKKSLVSKLIKDVKKDS